MSAPPSQRDADVIVVGAGNAAACAALTARAEGARVLMLERAPRESRAGNSAFTGGAYRFAHNGIEDLLKLSDISEQEQAECDFGTYTEEQKRGMVLGHMHNTQGPLLLPRTVRQVW